jgi:hypothetical protein
VVVAETARFVVVAVFETMRLEVLAVPEIDTLPTTSSALLVDVASAPIRS